MSNDLFTNTPGPDNYFNNGITNLAGPTTAIP